MNGQTVCVLRKKSIICVASVQSQKSIPAFKTITNNADKTPYWLEKEKNETTKITTDKSYFNLGIFKFRGDILSKLSPKGFRWKTNKKETIKDGDDWNEIPLCDDSLTSISLNRSVDFMKDQKNDSEHKLTTSQEEALIGEYLKYQEDLATRLGEFWREKPLTEEELKNSDEAQEVKLSQSYNSLNRLLNSYSATIDSLLNLNKNFHNYEKFLPRALTDRIPTFWSQSGNASILVASTENPDDVKVKSGLGLRSLLKNLEDEENRINKNEIKTKSAELKDELYQKTFACHYSPFETKTQDSASCSGNYSQQNIMIDPFKGQSKDFVEKTTKVKQKPLQITDAELEQQLTDLITSAEKSSSIEVINRSLNELNLLLKRNSKIRAILHEQKFVHHLKIRADSQQSEELTKALVRETLALAGHVNAIPKRGVRILSIDGGGVRAVMTVLLLQRLQEECGGLPLNDLFDFVIGVSTGSILAVLALVYRLPIKDCIQIYKLFSLEVFKRNIILGATRLVWNQAYYDSDYWRSLLREDFGDLELSHTARHPSIPKMAIVSAATNLPTLTPFVFRNYNLPPNTPSHYPGSCNALLWEAVRASSAAPGYFEEFRLRDIVHQDGGLIVNNPSALAIHEARLLWPNEDIQCLVSLGTGRYYPHTRENYFSSGLKSKIQKLIASATDTEAVHILLQDLLPKGRYYRFNPYMTEDILLDENRPEKIDQLLEDGELYLRKNKSKMEAAANTLMQDRQMWRKIRDLCNIT